MRRRDEVMSSDIQELEASLRQQEVVREQETPAEEIARLKEASQADHHFNVDREVQQGPAVGCVTHQTKWANNITGSLFSLFTNKTTRIADGLSTEPGIIRDSYIIK